MKKFIIKKKQNFFFIFLFLSLICFFFFILNSFQWSEVYHTDIVLHAPTIATHIPITIDTNITANLQKINFYTGLETEVFLNTVVYDVYLKDSNPVCTNYSSDTPLKIVDVLPNLEKFQKTGKSVVRGLRADIYYYSETVENIKEEYYFFYDIDKQQPIRFQYSSINIFNNSHYGDWTLDYFSYVTDVNSSLFVVPPTCSTNFSQTQNSEYTFGINSNFLRSLFPSENKQRFNHKFHGYLQKYSKKYENITELKQRETIFNSNSEFIENFNKNHETMKLGINKFADLTHEEFRNNLLINSEYIPKKEFQSTKMIEKPIKDYTLPSNLSWVELGAISAVKDQEFCGASWAFSVAGAIEGQYFFSTGELANFSVQDIIDCSENNSGCHGGSTSQAFKDMISAGGIALDSIYPFLGFSAYCAYTDDIMQASINYSTQIDPSQAEYALWFFGPLSIMLDASSQEIMFYQSGIFDTSYCQENVVNYAALLAGYYSDINSNPYYWLIKFSWGEDWGENGFIRLSRNGDCGVTSEMIYPVLNRLG
ncbi:hypothetical protein M0811_12767 [Anaeramoeba ignava]|uniref:Peptidase C1A papain C-terminal domain-containing protein n=1 Tax=Anaeramoeba ignava TaxID=1746090 RepID=A0A9Q0L8T6_ANAIG|nr:hypothetical protein M0811_12767 [Anaeramoeba ignava]